MTPTPTEGAASESTPPPDDPAAVDPSDWGFEFDTPGDEWFDRQREAETPRSLGSIGEYQLLDEVSRGGQGIVFRALQPGTNRPIALKRLLAGSFATKAMRRRFEREVEAAASLNHPNIVTVYGMELVDDLPVFAMEWIDGIPVTAWAGGERAPDAPETPGTPTQKGGAVGGVAAPSESRSAGRDKKDVLELFLRICDAIQHAHLKGILHRDLKPSNILVDAGKQPHVLDFGLAKRFFQPEGESREPRTKGELTLSADFIGTPAYASPEQLRIDRRPLDVRTDVYSLGVILFEMLTGRSPYRSGGRLDELMKAVESEDAPRPSSLDPRLDREIDTIVLTAMAKAREDRYASVVDFAADVRRYLAGEPILALPPSNWYQFWKLVKRNRVAFAVAALIVVSLAAFAFQQNRQANRLEREVNDKNDALEKLREREDLLIESLRNIGEARDVRRDWERRVRESLVDRADEIVPTDPAADAAAGSADPDTSEGDDGGI